MKQGRLTQVQSDLATLSSTVNGLATSNASLASDLAATQAAIDMLSSQLGNVASEEDLTAISEALAEVQADVRELLEANAVINQNITINNDATLLYAETLVGTATDDPNVIVNGFVSVTVNTSNFDAAEIARVNAVTAKLATVLQYVTISNTSSPSVAVDFSNLTFVDGDYSVSGADVNDDALRTVSGDLLISHGGAADYSQLTTVGGDVSIDPSVTSIDISNATIAGGVFSSGSPVGTLILAKATSVNIGTAQATTVSLTLAEGTVNLGYAGTISGNVLIEAPKAGTIDFAAETVSGNLTVSSLASETIFNATNLTAIPASTITAKEANFAKATTVAANSTITADTVTFPELTGNASGTLTLPTADNFVAPKFTISSNVTATDAKTVEFLSGSNTNLSAPAATSLTINEQGNTTSFDTSGYAALATVDITGKVNAEPTPTNVSNVITISGSAIKTASVGGMVYSAVVSGTAALTELNTSGNMRILNVNNAAVLEAINLGHDHIDGSDEAQLHFTNNAKLASVDLSSVSDVGVIQIENNVALTAFTAPATSPLSEVAATIVATVTGNKLQGTYTKATAVIPGTGTVATIPAKPSSIAQASVYGLRLWLEAHYSHTGSPTFNIEIDAMDSDADGAFDDGDYATVVAADGNNTTSDGMNQIDIVAELATVKE